LSPAAILQAGNPAGGPTAPTATAPDFWKFQGWVQKTCLEIMHRFRIEGIEMAYPTQAVYQVEGEKEEPRRGRREKSSIALTHPVGKTKPRVQSTGLRDFIYSEPLLQHLTQHILQNAAMLVIRHLFRRIHPHRGSEGLVRSVRRLGVNSDLLARR